MFAENASPVTVRNILIAFSARRRHRSSSACSGASAATFTVTSVALALILGGAFGNLYDRIRYHYVVDFLEVHIVHYHWPDFNVADSCIVIGACLLLIEIFRPQPKKSLSRPSDPERVQRAEGEEPLYFVFCLWALTLALLYLQLAEGFTARKKTSRTHPVNSQAPPE